MATTKIIQALERGLSILELFQKEKNELSIKEISELLDLNKSTVFGLVNTLSTLGYLQQDSTTQKYSLGLKVLTLSNAIKMNNILIRVVHPYLEELTQKYNETTHCAVEAEGSVVYIDKHEATSSIYINTQIGTKNYMHCTGVGKCILAFKSPNYQADIVHGRLKALTYNTLTNPIELQNELAAIRQNGYAMDNEEIEIGLSCVAVPVFSSPGNAEFAISLSAPTSRIQEKIAQGLITDLKSTAAKLSKLIYSYNYNT